MRTQRISELLLWVIGVGVLLVAATADLAWGQCELAKLVASDPQEGHAFSMAVALDGDVALVGAPEDDHAGERSGAAYVYRFDGTTWVEEAKLTAPDAAELDRFGRRVAVRGNVAMIGAYWDDHEGGVDAGSVHVFDFDGTAWVHQAKLTTSDAAAGDWFGNQIGLEGDVAVITAVQEDAWGTDSGAAYVFRFDGATWVEDVKLTASDGAAGDRFGRSVDLSGDVAVVGSYWDDDAGPDSGSAYVYRYDGANWIEEAKLTAADAAGGDEFGYETSISGDAIMIGARWDDHSGTDAGSAYVFRFDGSSWSQEAKLVASDAHSYDEFGQSLDVSGNLAVVGAYLNDDSYTSAGSAYVFEFDGSSWAEVRKLQPLDPAYDQFFGWGVRVSNSTAIIGARRDNNRRGAAYVFDLDGPDCNTNGACDSRDIYEGSSDDLDSNGIPDECEADSDGDGVTDADDTCPDSDLSATIVIDGCEAGVTNILLGDDGCTMADRISGCAEEATTHGGFVACVANLANQWKGDGLISGRDKGSIQRCAARAHIP